MNNIKYLDDIEFAPLQFKDKPLPHHVAGLSYTTSGYGAKIPTIQMVKYGNKWRRVYCTIYSNIGSAYIVSKNQKLFIRG